MGTARSSYPDIMEKIREKIKDSLSVYIDIIYESGHVKIESVIECGDQSYYYSDIYHVISEENTNDFIKNANLVFAKVKL